MHFNYSFIKTTCLSYQNSYPAYSISPGVLGVVLVVILFVLGTRLFSISAAAMIKGREFGSQDPSVTTCDLLLLGDVASVAILRCLRVDVSTAGSTLQRLADASGHEFPHSCVALGKSKLRG